MPADGLVFRHHLRLSGRCADIPTWLSPVDEGGAAAPAMGVRVLVRLPPEKEPGHLEPVVHGRVGGPHRLGLEPWHLFSEGAVRAHRVDGGQTLLAAYLPIDLAESGGQMDDPGSLVRLDEIPGNHSPPVSVISRRYVEIIEGAYIAEADQVPPGDPTVGAHSFAEYVLDQLDRHYRIAHHRVVEVRSHCGAGVGEQRPGGGGPYHQRQAGEGGQSERAAQCLG